MAGNLDDMLLTRLPVLMSSTEVEGLARKTLGGDKAKRFLERAKADVLLAGCLADVGAKSEGSVLAAKCAGSSGATRYSLRVALGTDPPGLWCSCPSGSADGLCKHLLALLLHRAAAMDEGTAQALKQLRQQQQQQQQASPASLLQPKREQGDERGGGSSEQQPPPPTRKRVLPKSFTSKPALTQPKAERYVRAGKGVAGQGRVLLVASQARVCLIG